ncbi:MAG TPA: UDP-N-acetylglucosamine 2-epimerase (non-hydrolyzing) [Bryobacteraceae bacterium]|nr:UDP-N-acetylglucosamine 2-epimerase (non-hydrolyzing) [Bryobacteraceae bacterium]
MRRILFVFGTRPEAIKLCPVIAHMRGNAPDFEARVCVTGQHRQMLDQVLNVFDIQPDYDLNVMAPGQSLFDSTARMLSGLGPVLGDKFDLVVVQGDTTTTLCGSLGAFYSRLPVAHVEAGLRTGDYQHPFPEEMNRVLTTRLTSLHFAATEAGAENLRREGIPDKAIWVTGNPIIDAIQRTSGNLAAGLLSAPPWPWLDPGKKLIVVTAHRRESFGLPFERICSALAILSQRPDVQIVYPIHPNPNVRAAAEKYLKDELNIVLVDPLSYVCFVDLMRRSYLLLTDSGGIQEEGPSLGKPVLVMRETTERPEGVAAGLTRLVGTDKATIVAETSKLLDDPTEYAKMTRPLNPYGDGHASRRIVEAIRSWFDTRVPE